MHAKPLFALGAVVEDPQPPGDLPPALAFVRAALRRGLPITWTVARTWQYPAGGWVIDLANETGQVIARIALFDPPQGGATEQDR